MSETVPKSRPPLYLLHAYGQVSQHDALVVAGDRSGLELLRGLIDKALAGMEDADPVGSTAYVNDGEGYPVVVSLASIAVMEAAPKPYSGIDDIPEGDEEVEAVSSFWGPICQAIEGVEVGDRT